VSDKAVSKSEKLYDELEFYADAAQRLQKLIGIKTKANEEKDSAGIFDGGIVHSAECSMCLTVVGLFDSFISNSYVQYVIENQLTKLCEGHVDKDVCLKTMRNLGPVIVENAVAFKLSPNYFCEFVLTLCDAKDFKELDPLEYINKILSDKPAHIQKDSFITDLYDLINADTNERKTFTML